MSEYIADCMNLKDFVDKDYGVTVYDTHVELIGEDGTRAWCSHDFYETLLNHPLIKEKE